MTSVCGMRCAGRAPGSDEICIIGGGEIFKQALDKGYADRIYLTVVEWPFEGDAYFPAFDEAKFEESTRETLSDKPPAELRILNRNTPKAGWKK